MVVGSLEVSQINVHHSDSVERIIVARIDEQARSKVLEGHFVVVVAEIFVALEGVSVGELAVGTNSLVETANGIVGVAV